jgi:hypothetical protein
VSRRQAQRWAAQGDMAAFEPQAQAPAPAPAASNIEQLKQLGELRDSGVLSEEEFQAEKAKLL